MSGSNRSGKWIRTIWAEIKKPSFKQMDDGQAQKGKGMIKWKGGSSCRLSIQTNTSFC